jgi:ATP-binding cassette subfamily B multidrug efflux pump
MLAGIAVLIVWIPRQIGHVVDGLAAGTRWRRRHAAARAAGWLLRPAWSSISCASAGACALCAAYRWAWSCASACTRGCRCRAPASTRHQRTGNLMALATNDIDAVEMAAGERCWPASTAR